MQNENKTGKSPEVLFSFSGEARGKMTGSVILAFIGEMFGMAPILW